MKKGQLYIVLTNRARAVLTKVGPSMVELHWTHRADGTPSDLEKRPISYRRSEIEKGLLSGDVIIADPEGDPNLMFLMKKRS